MSAATCDVCGHYLHGLDEMCGADHNGDMCECDGRIHYFCACGDRFETVADLTEHGRLCLTIAENEDHLVEGGHLDPSARRTPAPNTGWRRSEPAVIQTPDTQARLAARLLATYLPDETTQTNPSHVASGGR